MRETGHFYFALTLAAERLAAAAPGKLVGGYAYGAWKTPPVREKLHANVMIGFVGYGYLSDATRAAARQSWDGWARAAPHLFLRPNLLHDGFGYPGVYARRLGEDLRHCGETGMMAADFDSLTHHWAGQGLNYYVLARLLWNPSADVEAIIDDYCRKGFGPAAPAVRAYFDAMERNTSALAAAIPETFRGWNKEFPQEMLRQFSPEALAALRGHLDKARQLAAGDARVLERIQFLAQGLEYARLQTEAVLAVQAAEQGKDWAPARAAVEARERLLRENLYGFALGVPNIAYVQAARRTLFFGRERPAPRAATPAGPAPASPKADLLVGQWEGTWSSTSSGMGDSLRCTVGKADEGEYDAVFEAVFLKVLTHKSNVTLRVQDHGDVWRFRGEKDLGVLSGGVYRYEGRTDGREFFSTYDSTFDQGVFRMKRVGAALSPP